MELRKRKVFKYDMNSEEMKNHVMTRENFIWTTQQMKSIVLKDLDSNHLKNIVAKIKRGDHASKEMHLDTLQFEISYRAVEQELITKNHSKDGKKRSLQGIG
jgi:hypothetical protein